MLLTAEYFDEGVSLTKVDQQSNSLSTASLFNRAALSIWSLSLFKTALFKINLSAILLCVLEIFFDRRRTLRTAWSTTSTFLPPLSIRLWLTRAFHWIKSITKVSFHVYKATLCAVTPCKATLSVRQLWSKYLMAGGLVAQPAAHRQRPFPQRESFSTLALYLQKATCSLYDVILSVQIHSLSTRRLYPSQTFLSVKLISICTVFLY